MARFAGARDRVEAPLARSGRRVIGVNEPANTVFASGNSNEHKIFDHQRRKRNAVPLVVVGRADVPNDVACSCVKRNHVSVERAQKNFVAENSRPAIHAAATRPNIRRQRALILPNGPSRARIECKSAIVSPGGIEHAVDDKRRRFKFSSAHGLISPLGHERRNV